MPFFLVIVIVIVNYPTLSCTEYELDPVGCKLHYFPEFFSIWLCMLIVHFLYFPISWLTEFLGYLSYRQMMFDKQKQCCRHHFIPILRNARVTPQTYIACIIRMIVHKLVQYAHQSTGNIITGSTTHCL